MGASPSSCALCLRWSSASSIRLLVRVRVGFRGSDGDESEGRLSHRRLDEPGWLKESNSFRGVACPLALASSSFSSSKTVAANVVYRDFVTVT
jgi:hypothetical protein